MYHIHPNTQHTHATHHAQHASSGRSFEYPTNEANTTRAIEPEKPGTSCSESADTHTPITMSSQHTHKTHAPAKTGSSQNRQQPRLAAAKTGSSQDRHTFEDVYVPDPERYICDVDPPPCCRITPRRRQKKVIITPPCIFILYGESLMKITGWCQNDFNVHQG